MKLLQAFNMTTGEVVAANNEDGNKNVLRRVKEWEKQGDEVETSYQTEKDLNCTCERDHELMLQSEEGDDDYMSFYNLHGSCEWCTFIGE